MFGSKKPAEPKAEVKTDPILEMKELQLSSVNQFLEENSDLIDESTVTWNPSINRLQVEVSTPDNTLDNLLYVYKQWCIVNDCLDFSECFKLKLAAGTLRASK